MHAFYPPVRASTNICIALRASDQLKPQHQVPLPSQSNRFVKDEAGNETTLTSIHHRFGKASNPRRQSHHCKPMKTRSSILLFASALSLCLLGSSCQTASVSLSDLPNRRVAAISLGDNQGKTDGSSQGLLGIVLVAAFDSTTMQGKRALVENEVKNVLDSHLATVSGLTYVRYASVTSKPAERKNRYSLQEVSSFAAANNLGLVYHVSMSLDYARGGVSLTLTEYRNSGEVVAMQSASAFLKPFSERGKRANKPMIDPAMLPIWREIAAEAAQELTSRIQGQFH